MTQGKTTTETFVEEHKDNIGEQLVPGFYRKRIQNFNDNEKIDEPQVEYETGDEETEEEVLSLKKIKNERICNYFSSSVSSSSPA